MAESLQAGTYLRPLQFTVLAGPRTTRLLGKLPLQEKNCLEAGREKPFPT
jgi:hypothetical protein